jgi:hypothetical protein
MGIKLIKRCDQKVEEDKASQPSSTNDMTLTAQSWVKEFRERKSRLGVNPFVSKKDLAIPQACSDAA